MTTGEKDQLQTRSSSGRKKGRPTAGDENVSQVILLAAGQVYGECGYHGTTVAGILRVAGVSRSTFYRHFSDRHEAVDKVIESACSELLQAVIKAVLTETITLKRGQAGIRAYFKWCKEAGPIATSIYREVHLSESPARKHRTRIVEDFVNLVHRESLVTGEHKLEPLFYDTLFRAVEHLVHSAFTAPDCTDEEVKRRIIMAERIMLAALADTDDSSLVPPLSKITVE